MLPRRGDRQFSYQLPASRLEERLFELSATSAMSIIIACPCWRIDIDPKSIPRHCWSIVGDVKSIPRPCWSIDIDPKTIPRHTRILNNGILACNADIVKLAVIAYFWSRREQLMIIYGKMIVSVT